MNDFRLRTLKPRYEQLFTRCQIRSSWLDRIASAAATIQSLRSRYYDAIAAQTNVPWWFTGILHYRELGFREAHLHNGDPLMGRTLRNPPGRPDFFPANGRTYTFVESAVDALQWQTFDTAQDCSIAAWLWRFELWNGFDYAMRGMNSEYLWNGTNHFGSGNNRGKFLADKRFDPNAQSEQAGAAAILWYFYYKGMIDSGLQANVGRSQTRPNTTATLTSSATVLAQQGTIQLLDACKEYRQLPHQDLAIAWLQQQQSPAIIAEFVQRWQTNPYPVVTPTVQPTPQVPRPQVLSPVVTTTTTPQASSESLNQAIVKAAESLRGMSTADGPDGGNNACAWTLNRVLKEAGIRPLGDNPNYVPSLVEDLIRGRGRQVSRNEAKAGDLVVADGEAHIGVGLDDGCQTVISNSSSRANFCWESDTDYDGSYGGSSTIYRLLS